MNQPTTSTSRSTVTDCSQCGGEAVDPIEISPDQFACQDCVATPRIAFVGCGKAKKDVDEAIPAKDLYSSNYFGLKRQYAEEVCYAWFILSAEHGVIGPGKEIEPYDTTIGDLSDYELGRWAERACQTVKGKLRFYSPWTRPVVLAGEKYAQHIEDALPDDRTEWPFRKDDLKGIGDQMSWLKEQAEKPQDPGQSTVGDW